MRYRLAPFVYDNLYGWNIMQLRKDYLLQGGKYRIERVLGQGGFGITYEATQVSLQRKVAIKEFFMKEYCERDGSTSHVSMGTSGSREMVERYRQKFIKEAQTIAGLNHPHIIRIYDVFEENGTAYYAMEYVNHGSLDELVKRNGALDEVDALHYVCQIADALGYIHDCKMNHLDVKPSNVLLDDKNNAVLIDFGLSKRYDDEGNQTSTTPVGISHGYAPMEQYKNGGVGIFSPATDIYSLGATLYKLLTGETPPDADDVNDTGLPPFPKGMAPHIQQAILRAMKPRRSERIQSIAEFRQVLDAKVEIEEEVTIIDNDKLPETHEINPVKWIDFRLFSEKQRQNTSRKVRKTILWMVIIAVILLVLGLFSGWDAQKVLGPMFVILFMLVIVVVAAYLVTLISNAIAFRKIYKIEDSLSQALISATLNNHYGLVWIAGSGMMCVLQSPVYDKIICCAENMYICKRNKKVGLYNAKIRKMVIPVNCDYISLAEDGLYEVVRAKRKQKYSDEGYEIFE